jgi:predicted Rossmann-fold nucleotide-binding protein
MDLFTPPLQPNAWLTEERRVPDFFPRLRHLTSADAFVVLQGSIGTLAEATLVWSLLQMGQISQRPFIFVGEAWHRLLDAFKLETYITDRDLTLVTVVHDVDQAMDVLGDALSPSP